MLRRPRRYRALLFDPGNGGIGGLARLSVSDTVHSDRDFPNVMPTFYFALANRTASFFSTAADEKYTPVALA